ncbi:MAG: ABC transporter ATP-binding protein [Myxococcaceae bacterium]|jgi:iron(III) transport system ATP-binding protein|nr:ABC transporter ATP-binding protein [Myxococcaceae bacterium]
MAAVELIEIEKAFGATSVVKKLSLTVREGELVALLGPSGCGKTTTLRMIAGLERPDRGVVKLGGQLVDDGRAFVAPERRGLGMVFQSYAIWPHKSVFENVAYPLQLKGASNVEAAVKEALGWVRLEAYLHRRPHELSGGQLQRVALARALVGQPKVLLLDEPLSNLDVALREELRGEIASLRAKLGTTMILVTHDQAEALALADQVAVMNKGVIEQLAAPDVVYREPATPFVAGFVGGANVLVGEVQGTSFISEGVSFALPAGTVAPPGPHTLVVRSEDVVLGAEGPLLPLQARLFMGSATEYRLGLGDSVVRAVGSALSHARPGQLTPVSFRSVRLYAP